MTARQDGATPGPWIVAPFLEILPANDPHDDLKIIASAGVNIPEQEAEANARLISAAPDMLAALKAIVAMLERCEANDEASITDEFTEELEQQVLAAIAKATEGK